MSDYKHTPGPWTLETVKTSIGSCHKIGPFPSLGVRKETHACVYADSIRIGIDDRVGVSKVGDELLANAKLIASAPDLLSERDLLREHAGMLRDLLSEAKFRLKHTRCLDDDASRCPACGLEANIESALAQTEPKARGTV